MTNFLVQETIDTFGYDPRTLKPKSSKRVAYRCSVCNEVGYARLNGIRENHQCGRCSRRERMRAHEEECRKIGRPPKGTPVTLDDFPQLLVEQTTAVFGYSPLSLGRTSAKRVVFLCADCKLPQETAMKTFTFETQGRGKGEQICWGCAQARKTKARAAAMRAQGMALNGKPLDPDRVRQRARIAERAREKNATPVGNLKSRLQNSLRRLKADRFHVSQNLGYDGQELLAHVSARIAHHGGNCPICQTASISIEDLKSFEIEHRIPTSSARTETEMSALFSLDNLDVACRKCNRWLKAQYMRDYWTTPKTIRNFADRDQLLDAQTLPEMVRLAELLRTVASEASPPVATAKHGNAGRMYTHDGITQPLTDWAEHSGVPKTTIVWRLKAGVPFAEAIRPERPKYPKARKKITMGNTGMTFDIATAIRRRIDEGATRKQVMTEFPNVSKYQISDLLKNHTWSEETVWWTERQKAKPGPSR